MASAALGFRSAWPSPSSSSSPSSTSAVPSTGSYPPPSTTSARSARPSEKGSRRSFSRRSGPLGGTTTSPIREPCLATESLPRPPAAASSVADQVLSRFPTLSWRVLRGAGSRRAWS